MFIIVLTLALTLAVMPSCKEKTPPVAPPSSIFAPQVNKLPTRKLQVAGTTFTTELAFTRQTRAQGMMYRQNMQSDEAMLFVFKRSRALSFYMENCLIDLDIIYLTYKGQIDSIYEMKIPKPNRPVKYYYSQGPVRYALELPAGTATKLNLKVGQSITIPRNIKQIIPESD